MKAASSMLVLGSVSASEVQSNPMGAVMAMIDEVQGKIMVDGEKEDKLYHNYFEWCDETNKNTGFAIDDATKQKEKLEAQIGELTSDITVATSKIEELAEAIANAEKELEDAQTVRTKEEEDFLANEKELSEAISALSRAIGILEKEMAKNPASFAQIDTSNIAGTLQAFSAVLEASSVSTSDMNKLLALVQSQSNAKNSDDDELGEPAAATYKTHSTGIFDVLEDMKEKAETQLSTLRKEEVTTKQNYNMLKQSLEAQRDADTGDMKETKASRTAAEEDKATAEGDLKMTLKELAASTKQQATVRSTCVQVGADHEANVAARKEELAVIAQAKKILSETSAGAVSQTYSFIQTAVQMQSSSDLAVTEVVDSVKRLAKQEHSAALAQLASRIGAVARYGGSDDPFGKIKGLIMDMISKLEKEAGADATEKAYCDEQIAKTEFKKGELEDDIAKYTGKIDKAASKSAQLKSEIKTLLSELGALAKEQATMDTMRKEENDEFNIAKADLELGLSGVRKALGLLRDYYGGASSMLQDDAKLGAFMQQPKAPEQFSKKSGAGGSIIDILEVCESDFATNLAKEEAQEADSLAEYEKVSQENAVTKATKDQDVKYKTQEAKAMDSTVSEYSGDREAANDELSAVLTYYDKIKERCIAKPETYEERKRRREEEIKGLKTALSILENETAAFMQRKHHGRRFRGTLSAQ